MSFSNEDRDRLIHQISQLQIVTVYTSTMKDIFERLEAAELCARYLDAMSENYRSPRENEALIAWRKAMKKDKPTHVCDNSCEETGHKLIE